MPATVGTTEKDASMLGFDESATRGLLKWPRKPTSQDRFERLTKPKVPGVGRLKGCALSTKAEPSEIPLAVDDSP